MEKTSWSAEFENDYLILYYQNINHVFICSDMWVSLEEWRVIDQYCSYVLRHGNICGFRVLQTVDMLDAVRVTGYDIQNPFWGLALLSQIRNIQSRLQYCSILSYRKHNIGGKLCSELKSHFISSPCLFAWLFSQTFFKIFVFRGYVCVFVKICL